MSIALDRSNAAPITVFDSPPPPLKMDADDDDDDSCSSSSIGKNSDDEDGDGEEAIQSKFNDSGNGVGAFNSLQALEQVLPMRSGISSFYSGKSKSFASLSSFVSSSSIKEIAKPENAYTRKRRNLMASSSHVWDRNHHHHRSGVGSGICKKSFSSSMRNSRSSLALAVAMSRSSSSDSSGSSQDSCNDFRSHSTFTRLHTD